MNSTPPPATGEAHKAWTDKPGRDGKPMGFYMCRCNQPDAHGTLPAEGADPLSERVEQLVDEIVPHRHAACGGDGCELPRLRHTAKAEILALVREERRAVWSTVLEVYSEKPDPWPTLEALAAAALEGKQ